MSTVPPPAAKRHRPRLSNTALGRRGYPLYLVAMLQGSTGFWVAKIAQDWLLLQLTGDVAAVGVASSLQFFPVLVFGLWGGVLADRFNVKDLVVVAQVMQAVSAASLAVLALTDVIAAWHVFVAAFVVGLSSTLEQPGRAGIIGQLAGPHLGQAISLNSIAFQASGFWGPMGLFAIKGVVRV